MPILVAIVEDNRGMREKFVALLNQFPELHCVSSYATAEHAVRDMMGAKPDVALVDIHLPRMNGIECVSHLKEQMPGLQVLMLTRYEQGDLIFESLRAGASGYLLKNSPPAELVEAIKQIHSGGAPMSMQIARRVVEYFRRSRASDLDMEKLTPREQQLLELLAKGYYYWEMADQLGVTMSTVRAHLHAVYKKLHVRSRSEATLKFLGRA